METEDSIYFYGMSSNFGYMSNFYKSKFVDKEGNNFCCSEQYLMYWKAKTFEPENESLLKSILKETSAAKIKALGRTVKNYNDTIWSQIRLKIMVKGLKLKFKQNSTILALLLSTGDKTLYEASKQDKIWGIGYYAEQAILTEPDKYGTNLLGQALMKVRNKFLIKNNLKINNLCEKKNHPKNK
jgi:ribA/ribD-fused uncharacterized protein